MKISQYTAITSAAPNDLIPIVDMDDHTMAASGTTKVIAVSNLVTGGGGAGTVTNVQVSPGNGFSASVANPGTTPNITIQTTVSGLLIGNGTSVSAATPGTDYVSPTGSGAGLTGITASQVGAVPASSLPLSIANGGTGNPTGAPQNNVFAGPATGGSGAPAFRALVATDVPQLPDYAPTGLTGATAASRYGGGTTTSFPATGSWNSGDWTIDQAGAIWLFSSAGRWMRWGDEPHQFRPESYGAKRDGKVVTDAVMVSGSPNIACTTSTPFTSTGVDGGKHILVSTATGSLAHLAGTISTVTDTGHAVLSASATANTGGTPGAITYFGTDDTAAIQAAITAAVAYAQAHGGFAEVVFASGIYIIAGAFTAQALGNAQLALPVISPTATFGQITLKLRGAMDTTPLMHWLQVFPQASGTILACASTSGTADTGSGPSCVIGSPVSGYGGEPGLYSNCVVQVKGIGMLLPYNGGVCGMDLFGMIEADVDSFSCMAAAVVPTSSAPAPSLATPNSITHQWTFGLRMPTTGNQTVCRVTRFSTEGLTYGLCPSEWTWGDDIHIMYAIVALGMWAGGVTMVHSALIVNVQAENCTNMLGMASTNSAGTNGTGTARLDVLNFQTEVTGPVFDPTSQIQGTLHVRSQGQSGAYTSGGYLSGGTGGAQLRIINEMTTPGVIGPPSVPASGTAFPNYYCRDATVLVTGGSVTGITIDSTPLGLTSGMVPVPAGHSITLTYTPAPALAPSWTWILL